MPVSEQASAACVLNNAYKTALSLETDNDPLLYPKFEDLLDLLADLPPCRNTLIVY